MHSVSLVAVCGVAFTAVFALLSVLAALMVAVTKLFPERAAVVDAALVAAVAGAVAALHPGARLTHIEEDR